MITQVETADVENSAIVNQDIEFHYQVSWRSHSAVPGHHYSTHSGGGFEFYGHAPLLSNPVPRNLDIRASLQDPLGHYVVKTFRQQSAIPVFVIADLSASMAYPKNHDKQGILTRVSAAIAYSAFRSGDPFAFIGCGESIDRDFLLPLRWYKSAPSDLFERLKKHNPQDRSATALLQAAPLIGRKKALVFLVSDFYFSSQFLVQLLQNLELHDVVPIMICDKPKLQRPRWGVARFSDAESGTNRLLILRPSLLEKMQVALDRHRQTIADICIQFGRKPFMIENHFDPEELTRYFFEST